MYRRHLKNALHDGFDRFEFVSLDANGEELPVEAIYIRVPYQGKYAIVGYNYDLRQLKNAQQLKIATESNKAKSRFLAKMSHEIRTPITAVLGISEVELRKSDSGENQKNAFAKIHNSANVLLGIVNDILDLSRIEAGKMELVCGEYDTASMINDLTHTHLAFLGDRDIQFVVCIDEKLPCKLVGDVLRIKQIINNLLSNAFKYTDSGKVEFSLKWVKNCLIISVNDTGLGMSHEQIDVLKDAYTRFHEQELRHIDGAGLGMPIVYNMVHMMDGQIGLDSEVGKGTHVTVRIPQTAASEDVLGENLVQSLERFENGVWSAVKSLHFVPEAMPYGSVLVVDDVDTNLYVVEAMLEAFSLNIELCETATEAISKIKKGKSYDIIFMDHMMPGMNGIEATKILREMGYSLPIVAFSANTLKGHAEMFMANGFSGFMSKPIDINHLNSFLVRYIKNKHEELSD
jgi:signal transduction histidine kinase/ActR/RegA family two-component response regulator